MVKYINKAQSSVPTLTDDSSDGLEVANTDSEKANALNNFFSSCYNHTFPPLSSKCSAILAPDACPNDLLCTEEEILDYLSSLDTAKANGPDGISARNPQDAKGNCIKYHQLINKPI